MKNIKNLSKLILFIGFSLEISAQSKILVLDELTKEPILFATIIYNDNVGTFTNEKGLLKVVKI